MTALIETPDIGLGIVLEAQSQSLLRKTYACSRLNAIQSHATVGAGLGPCRPLMAGLCTAT